MKELKMNQDNKSNSDQDTNESQENSLGKVLPFRRPTPQPTLVRRSGNGVGTNQGIGRDKSKLAASALERQGCSGTSDCIACRGFFSLHSRTVEKSKTIELFFFERGTCARHSALLHTVSAAGA